MSAVEILPRRVAGKFHGVASTLSANSCIRLRASAALAPVTMGMTGSEKGEPVDLFLSYNHADEAWVEALANRLEKEVVGDRPLRVFFAPWSVLPGQNFMTKIDDALGKARYVGVVLTPTSTQSDFVRMEWTSSLVDDPAGRQGRLIVMLLQDCEVPPLLKPLSRLDFRRETQFQREYNRLLLALRASRAEHRAQSNDRASGADATPHPGDPFDPDDVDETLESNLYPVARHPRRWRHAPTTARSFTDVVTMTDRGRLPPFILREGRLYSFSDLQDPANPLRAAVSPRQVLEDSVPSASDNRERRWFIELLNKTLREHLYHKGIKFDLKHGRFYFLPSRDGGARKETWTTPSRKAPRTVAEPMISETTNELLYWRHRCATLSFIELGDYIFLQIEPAWTFTKDGHEPIEGRRLTRLTVKKMYREGNDVVLNDVRFWADIISPGDRATISLETGADPVEVTRVPAFVPLAVGIVGDTTISDGLSAPPDASSTTDEVAGEHAELDDDVDDEDEEGEE